MGSQVEVLRNENLRKLLSIYEIYLSNGQNKIIHLINLEHLRTYQVPLPLPLPT